jgi:acetylornithine deacetylase/succinyl-diaminopimelate desuccinylase-like protein
MGKTPPEVDRYIKDHRSEFEEDLFEFLRIPSVSADSQHKEDTARAADWVAQQFDQLGFQTERIETSGHPIILSRSPRVEGAPTALVYGHYDVQPPDPLAEWISPPFEPTVRDGNVYARGATDDKGQMLTHLKSAQAWIKVKNSLPLNLIYLIEGEEEVGSEHLEHFIESSQEDLACDCVVISDTSQFAPGQPAITYGLRGIAYYELRLSGPSQDLHSGTFGGAVTNPANALAMLLAKLVDSNGKIQIPGFYDAVVPLTTREREGFQALSFSEQRFQDLVGVKATSGESGFSTLERRCVRPSYDINGIWSGYQGEGAKTVLPAKAGAKFSFRLVPDQDPQVISRQLEGFLQEHLPAGITMELIDLHGAPGVVVPLDSPYVEASARAIEHGFGTPPVYVREGGSIPIVSAFTNFLRADSLLLGWGQNDDNTHSPNEKFNLSDYHRGIRTSACLWSELAVIA